ncbi:tetratricopeptide repeat protein [Hymenobacter sp. IS2118]|uniref:tetratricopeptide repeat protein n=1 Tax=Hymenobacter sp. IS2118 TaxID=1505605 RepID=UPI0012687D62|nr:hypothetical protein [Hymenobacter sp. IS2118]
MPGINLVPMYGRVKKCPEQIAADQQFFAYCEKTFKSRQEAAAAFASRGWDHFYANELDVSMKRFNQAWMLDSTNTQVYWGFGNILGKQRHFAASRSFLRLAIRLNPTNAKVLNDASNSYINHFLATKNFAALDTSVLYLKQAIKLNPKQARPYADLTAAYYFYSQPDSARKYLAIADKLDPAAVDKQVRKKLKNAK